MNGDFRCNFLQLFVAAHSLTQPKPASNLMSFIYAIRSSNSFTK